MSYDIIASLRRLGPSAAGAIAKDLGVSQPTVSRLVSANAGRIARVGGSKNTVYGAARRIRQLQESSIPVFGVDEAGNASLFGNLCGVHPQGFLWSAADSPWPLEQRGKLYFHSIPYFIHDPRPQGFMGRNFARIHADTLGVPDNPERWSDDDVIVAMAILGDDLSGNLIVGEASYRRFAARQPEIIAEPEIGDAYLGLAQRAVSTGEAGSSAAGEFPKFTATRTRNGVAGHVIVKFSGSGDSPAEQRWADLLRCEAHAAAVVAGHLGMEAAPSMAFAHGGRIFMESVRFDRVGLRGRRAMCSLAALDAELVGMGDPHWDKFADKLLAMRLVSRETAEAMRTIWTFGKLIGNSDMHAGNLSFRPADGGRLELCPIYDMLPMRYAPLRGGEVPEIDDLHRYVPMPGNESAFEAAGYAAREFWGRVSLDQAISPGFREIAETWINNAYTKQC